MQNSQGENAGNYDYCTNERVETIKTAGHGSRGYALRAREGVRASAKARLKILTYKYQFRAQCNLGNG